MSSPQSDLRVSTIGNLHNLTALVTGGGTGLGLAMAKALASNGANVYISGRRKEKLDEAAKLPLPKSSGKLIPIQMDVTSKESIERAKAEIIKETDRMDILINNAGIAGDDSPFDSPPPSKEDKPVFGNNLFKHQRFEEWEKIYKSNTIAPFMVTNAFLELLMEGANVTGGTSSVINISSAVTHVRVAQNLYAYKASKAALESVTQALATEYALKEIPVRVNAIAPGLFASEMTRSEKDLKSVTEKSLPGTLHPIPLKRPGKEEEIAMSAMFLAGVGGSYMTGQTLVVDGGFEAVNP